jgi:hypothetical protein
MRMIQSRFLKGLLSLGLAFLAYAGGDAMCAEPLSKAGSILIKSEPAGARVCERKGDAVVCFSKTPCRVPVESESGAHARKYYIKRIGYESMVVTVRPTDKTVNIPLKKRDIFAASGKEGGSGLAIARRTVSGRLSEKIYRNPGGVDDSGFDLVGKIDVSEAPDGNYAVLKIMLDDAFRKDRLRPVRSIQNRNERQAALARSVLEHGGGRLILDMAKPIKNVEGLKGVILVAYYAKTKSSLGEDYDRFTTQQTREYQFGDRKYTQYEIWTHDVATTKVEDRADVYAVVVKADMKDIAGSAREFTESVLKRGEIYSNDNERKQTERVQR